MSDPPHHDIPPGYASASNDAAPNMPYYTHARASSDQPVPDAPKPDDVEVRDEDKVLRESLTQFTEQKYQPMLDVTAIDPSLITMQEYVTVQENTVRTGSGEQAPVRFEHFRHYPNANHAQQKASQDEAQHVTQAGHEPLPQSADVQQNVQQQSVSSNLSSAHARIAPRQTVQFALPPDSRAPDQESNRVYPARYRSSPQRQYQQSPQQVQQQVQQQFQQPYQQQYQQQYQQYQLYQKQQHWQMQQQMQQQQQQQQQQYQSQRYQQYQHRQLQQYQNWNPHQQRFDHKFAPNGYGISSQLKQMSMPIVPYAADQVNMPMLNSPSVGPAWSPLSPKQNTTRQGYQIRPGGSEHYIPTGAMPNVHSSHGYEQHANRVRHLADANVPGQGSVVPVPAQARLQIPPFHQYSNNSSAQSGNPFVPNPSARLPTTNAQQGAPFLSPAYPSPVPSSSVVHALPPTRNQVAQPYVRGQGRFPFKPVPAHTRLPRISEDLTTSVESLKRKPPHPARAPQDSQQTQQHRKPTQKRGKPTQQRENQAPRHTDAWDHPIAQVQLPQSALTVEDVYRVMQEQNRRRADPKAQPRTEKAAPKRVRKQSLQRTETQRDVPPKPLPDPPQRQPTQQVQQNARQQIQQPQQQAQHYGHVQVQQANDASKPAACATPVSRFKRFFQGLAKNFEAPSLPAKDGPSIFEPMFPMFSRSSQSSAQHDQTENLTSNQPEDLAPNQPETLTSNPPVQNAIIADVCDRCLKPVTSEDETEEPDTDVTMVDATPHVPEHECTTSDRRMSVEAHNRGVDHIDLTGAAPVISDEPEELSSAGHATAADHQYTAAMDEIRRNATASTQLVTQEPAEMIEDTGDRNDIHAPPTESGLALTSVPNPASATTPELQSDFNFSVGSDGLDFGASPFADYFDGAGGAPTFADNSGILHPSAFAEVLGSPIPMGAGNTASDAPGNVVAGDSAPQDFDSSPPEPSRVVHLKVNRKFLESLEQRSLIVRLRFKPGPASPQSLRVGLFLLPEYRAPYLPISDFQLFDLEPPSFQTSEISERSAMEYPARSDIVSDSGRTVERSATPGIVRRENIAISTVRDTLYNFATKYHQHPRPASPDSDEDSQNLHRTPYNPIHSASLGLPANLRHAAAMAKVRGPDFDFSFSENEGVDAPLPDDEARRLCTVDPDGSLRAPDMPFDEMRANLEFELKQAEAVDVGVNHNDVVFDIPSSRDIAREPAISNIDAHINIGMNATEDVTMDGMEDAVLSNWLQDWVLKTDSSDEAQMGCRMDCGVDSPMESTAKAHLSSIDTSLAGMELGGVDSLGLDLVDFDCAGPVDEWFPDLFQGLDL